MTFFVRQLVTNWRYITHHTTQHCRVMNSLFNVFYRHQTSQKRMQLTFTWKRTTQRSQSLMRRVNMLKKAPNCKTTISIHCSFMNTLIKCHNCFATASPRCVWFAKTNCVCLLMFIWIMMVNFKIQNKSDLTLSSWTAQSEL